MTKIVDTGVLASTHRKLIKHLKHLIPSLLDNGDWYVTNVSNIEAAKGKLALIVHATKRPDSTTD
jgi:bifunctional N-acetylglucosamine-1-phosphate-uridyltransferase/glucosamine-1-phosphate-acetyltransferase GlmU-like protein